MLFCINNKKRNANTAGVKAPEDVFEIARKAGAGEIVFYHTTSSSSTKMNRIKSVFVGYSNWKRLRKTVHEGDVVILQHPNENITFANHYIDRLKKRGVHFIAIIHDLDSLRKRIQESDVDLSKRNALADEVLLKKCDAVICHNDRMREYLISTGFDRRKLVTLKIFDYLHDCKLPTRREKRKSVVVAGNLMKGKCEYLYRLLDEPLSMEIDLFGPNFTGNATNNVHYHGVCPPQELPGKLEGSFGLVWDGSELDRCSGNAGEYIRYNNPHKCSLFLASNMPVIIWKEAALASFVEENGIGITVDSLREIPAVIDSMSEDEYDAMVARTQIIGQRLRAGAYFSEALAECERILEQ